MRHYTFILLILCLGLALQSFQPVNGFEDSARSKKGVWSGYWWPMRRGEILVPLSKYDQQHGKKSAEWERKNNPSGPNIPQWFGYCHAWSASAVLEEEPTKVIQSGSQNLTVGDQKGLLAISHTDDDAEFFGVRFEAGGDPNDIEPTELWAALKTYIKEKGLPIVADIEPGTAVWNYPIYAYKVVLTPQGAKGFGTIEIWFADDAVGKDFIGLKACYKKYTFELQLDQNGQPVMGSGKWTGNSVKDHPDFLWYPTKAKPENPEVEYVQVKKMLHCAPEQPEPEPETEPEPEQQPEQPQPEPEPEIPAITPPELVKLIADQTSDFMLDITVDRFDGGMYKAGEKITVTGKSEKSGYLYLIGISPKGSLTVLYPQKGDKNEIQAGQEFAVPGSQATYSFSIASQPGLYRVKAIVTDKPLVIAGWDQETTEPARTNSGSLAMDIPNFRWNPSTAEIANDEVCEVWNNRTGREGETVKKRFNLTRFAQDEVAFIIRPSN